MTTTTIPAEFRAAGAPKSGTGYTLTWGLISVPVKLMTGTESGHRVRRSKFTPDGHPIGSTDYDKDTGKLYDGEIVMRTKVGDDWVDLTDEELEAAIGETVPPGVMKIESFIPLATIGAEYAVEKLDQVRPAERKVGSKRMPDEAANRGFALLMAAMRKRKVAALVTIPRRGAVSYGAITPDGDFRHLLFSEQVRESVEIPAAKPKADEMKLGLQLLDAVGVDTPVLVDEASARVREYAEAKAAGAVKPKRKLAAVPAPTDDLTEALAASLAAAS